MTCLGGFTRPLRVDLNEKETSDLSHELKSDVSLITVKQILHLLNTYSRKTHRTIFQNRQARFLCIQSRNVWLHFYCQFRRSTSLFRSNVFFSDSLIECSFSVFTSSLTSCREQFRIFAASAALMIRSEANARKSSAVSGTRLPIL